MWRHAPGHFAMVVTAFLTLAGSSVLLAELPPEGSAASATAGPSAAAATTPDLLALVEVAKTQFRPLPEGRLARAEADLTEAAAQLDRFLATGGAANAEQWKEYLRWDETLAELQKSDGPAPSLLQQLLPLYYNNHGSLEHPRFTAMRSALLEYRYARGLTDDAQLAERYVAQLDTLAKHLTAYQEEPSVERGQAIGSIVGWLEIAGQAPELVAAVRACYVQPNLYTVVSERMVNAGFTLNVTETQDVQDCILGTSIRGQATMRGRTRITLLECADRARLLLTLDGTIHSNNVGVNRGVRILSNAQTSVEGTKVVFLDKAGLSSERPQVWCDTNSVINAIQARCGIVEKIAWKRASKSKGTAEQIGSRHAEERVAAGMEQRAAEILAKAGDEYQQRFRRPLLRRDEFPQNLKFRTTPGQMHVVWSQANASQLAAPNTPDPLTGSYDLAVQLHESFVSNFSRAMLGGIRLTDKRLVEILQKNGAEVPEELVSSDGVEAWAITFSARDPISATFSDHTVRFAIRGSQFESGENRVRRSIEMSATYNVEKTPAGAMLTRQGDVSVEYVGVTGQLPAEDIAIRSVMRKKFEALFRPQFETTGITLPGRWEEFGTLHLEELVTHSGWLNLAWTQAPSAPKSTPPEAVTPPQQTAMR